MHTHALRGHLQGVQGAQALEGIRSYLRDLVVAQVSAVEKKKKKTTESDTEARKSRVFLGDTAPTATSVSPSEVGGVV